MLNSEKEAREKHIVIENLTHQVEKNKTEYECVINGLKEEKEKDRIRHEENGNTTNA